MLPFQISLQKGTWGSVIKLEVLIKEKKKTVYFIIVYIFKNKRAVNEIICYRVSNVKREKEGRGSLAMEEGFKLMMSQSVTETNYFCFISSFSWRSSEPFSSLCLWCRDFFLLSFSFIIFHVCFSICYWEVFFFLVQKGEHSGSDSNKHLTVKYIYFFL